MAVQYAGFGGREPPIDAAALRPELELAGEGLRTGGDLSFFEACKLVEELRYDGRPLHSGLRYGLSQALLALAAHTQACLPAHVLMESLGERALMPVPIYAQSGEERHTNVDKMILKDVDVLPHGLINSPTVFGTGGRGSSPTPRGCATVSSARPSRLRAAAAVRRVRQARRNDRR